MTILSTSFRRLYDHEACADRYRHLAKALGGISKYGRTKPITILQILENNGLEDALWALPTVPRSQEAEMEKFARLFARWCARNTPLPDGRTVWDLLADERSKSAIGVAERYANGGATKDELSAAWSAARLAAWSAAFKVILEVLLKEGNAI